MGDQLFIVAVRIFGVIGPKAFQIIVAIESCPLCFSDGLQNVLASVGVGLYNGFEGVGVPPDGVQYLHIKLQIFEMQNQALPKFDHKKVFEYLLKQKNSLTTLAAFFKSSDQYQKNSIKIIQENMKDIKQATAKINNNQIANLLSNFSIHQAEKQEAGISIRVINQKITTWLFNASEIITQLQQKSRNLQRLLSQNKSLSQQQIIAFKQQLQTNMMKVYELREFVISTYGHRMIKICCQQIEDITSKMQNQLERGFNK